MSRFPLLFVAALTAAVSFSIPARATFFYEGVAGTSVSRHTGAGRVKPVAFRKARKARRHVVRRAVRPATCCCMPRRR